MKTRILIFLLLSFINSKASDSLQIQPKQNKRFMVGVSVSLISATIWNKTDTFNVVLQRSDRDEKPYYRLGVLNPIGVTLSYKIYKFLYLETGGIFSDQKLYELADHWPDPKTGGGQNYSYSYEMKCFQLPVSITYMSNQNVSLYLNVGVKNNFVYKENFHGYYNTYSYNPQLGPNGWTTYSHPIDITSNSFKFNNIVPAVNIGVVVWFLKRKLGLMTYAYWDMKPFKKKENTVFNFETVQLSIVNLKVLYRF